MDLRSWGYVLLAVGFVSTVPQWLGLDLPFEAATSVVAALGLLAALRWPAMGLAVAAAMSLAWAVRFPGIGISVPSTAAAYAWVAGFAAMAYGRRSGRLRPEALGMALVGAGNLWYLVDNAVLSWTPGFAFGNVLFVLATAAILGHARREAEADAPRGTGRPARQA